VPTAVGWSAFRRQLDRFDVWRWSALYANFDVMDGTSWHVELRYPDQGIRSSGNSNYPPNFKAFLLAVRALIGGREFQ
jgi:hypothetical protein